MELLNNKKNNTATLFLYVAIALLAFGMLFGLLGTFQYFIPGLAKQYFSFEKTRPLHVSSVLFWILLAASGGVLSYLQEYTQKTIRYPFLLKLQWLLFSGTVIVIIGTYFMGIYGGREYWEFNPVLALPLILAWIFFIINFLGTIGSLKNQPVYVWMWLTGLVFFLFTFLESYLWVFPYFRNNIINDMTIQWKSYGSMVGAWNMLIYGSGIYLLEKISGQKSYGHSSIAFVLYFTSLTNLMFNWGHHIYTLPTHHFIKHISYVISMSELFIFGRIIYKWKDTVSEAQKLYHHFAYKFLLASDIWVFLSLALAIGMSIPAINVYTHGTHITVAHAMGTTIGINSFILLAIVLDILYHNVAVTASKTKWMLYGFWLVNFSLLFFWCSLIGLGIIKSNWQMQITKAPFNELMTMSKPLFITLSASGTLLLAGFFAILIPLIKSQFKNAKTY